MDDRIGSIPQGWGEHGGARWLLLIHQLPPRPDYLRVKVRRRLRGLGAVALKSTVYALPNTDAALEDFHWLVQEIEALGGSAVLCEASFIAGITDEELEAMLETDASASGREAPRARVERVAPGRTWVTRRDVHVDRIASAWLIARFIDREARFKFVPSRGYAPRPGELRFDMFRAEYTHEGERCTFQVLAARFGLDGDPGIRALGEIVHDIDCKDRRFDRPETAGVASLIRGIVAAHDDDAARLARGAAALDDFHAAFSRGRGRAGGRL